jgi:hypothetical protein
MTKLGVNHPNRKAFETALKTPLDAVRCYNVADARSAHADGYKVVLSYKPTVSWSAAASGAETASDKAIATEVASWGPGHIVAKQHEPENDGLPAADFIAMETRFKTDVSAILAAAGSKWGICLMGQTFKDGNASTWLGSLKPDILAADAYLWRGATGAYAPSEKQASHAAFTAFVDYCKTNGYAPELWEFGCSRTQADSQGVERSKELERFAAAFKDKFASIHYFESPPPKVDWQIRNEPRSMTAFASMKGAVVVPPPVDDCADEIAAAVAPLNAKIGALELELDSTKAKLATSQATVTEQAAKIANAQAALA